MAAPKKASASEVREWLGEFRARSKWSPSDLISLLRGGGSSGKGGEYERELCKRLSLWWTHGARDDVFWRSSGSGARAKVRGRAGADTVGQHGDVACTDPIGWPLIDLFTIEIKRGYSEHTMQDVFDCMPKAAVQEYGRFLGQAMESYEQAGSYAWLLITRRDRREPFVWLPRHVVGDLRGAGGFMNGRPRPYVTLNLDVRTDTGVQEADLVGLTLDDFLSGVTPEVITRLHKDNA